MSRDAGSLINGEKFEGSRQHTCYVILCDQGSRVQPLRRVMIRLACEFVNALLAVYVIPS